MMNGTQINCTSSTITTTETATTADADDTVATYAASAAGDADATTSTSTAAMPPEFVQLTETRRYIYRAIAAIHDESFNKLMIRLLRQYECAIREGFESAQYSPSMCRKLAHSIIALTDQIHTLSARRAMDSGNTRLYQQRMSFIVATYIACELGAAQDRVERERFILERITSMLSLYVEVNDVESGALKENTLRTLVAIPKVFGQANIITVLYSRLFPQWSATYGVFTQVELPDKIYIEYIIIFYCWQRLERDEAIRQRILEFAGKFMRPSSTLPFNTAYMNYLPDYNAPRTATRCILDQLNLQQSCTGLRAASRLDNRLSQTNEFILDSDEEKAAAESSSIMASAMAAAITMTITPQPPAAPDPPEFLKVLCENANRLEPVIRAAALYRGIDTMCEVVDLCESDEDVEMFSLDFSVPANVDGIGSNSNDGETLPDDDNAPVTRIFSSNLRTYQRSTSGAANSSAPVSTSPTETATYTMPRIVNSYSCRRDSLHLVSTTQTPTPTPLQLVDQCVQTAEDEQEEPELDAEQQRQFSYDDDATSTNRLYSNIRLSTNTTTSTTTELLHAGSAHTQYNNHHNHHCHQLSSRNSNSSEASHKKQVTFSSSSEYLGEPSSSLRFTKSLKVIKPSIKRHRNMKNISTTTPTSSNDRIESLKWIGRNKHLEDSQRMFSKLEVKKNCDKRTEESLPSCDDRRKRRAPDKRLKKSPTKISTIPAPTPETQLTPTTSNASSGAPTPQPKRQQPHGQQSALPTPPTSSHSSHDTDPQRRPSWTPSEFEKVQKEVNNYKFNRRKFSASNAADVRFYNNLLKLQRMKLYQRRCGDNVVTKAPLKSKSANNNLLKLNRLRAANTKLHQTIDQLQNDIDTICNYAVEELNKMPSIEEMSLKIPVVRLKRLNIEKLKTVEQRNIVDAVDAADVSANPVKLVKRQWTRRRRRRKGHGWSKQYANKKKMAAAATAALTVLEAEPVPAWESDAEPSATENSTVEMKIIVEKKKAKQPVAVPTSNSSTSTTDTIPVSSSSSNPATSPALATASPTTPLLNTVKKKKIVKKWKAKHPEAVETSASSASATDTIPVSSSPSNPPTSLALAIALPTTRLLNPVEKKKIVKKRKAKPPEAVSTSNNSASGTDTISTSSPPSDLVTSPALVTVLPTTHLLNPIEKKKIVKKRKAKQPEAVSTSNNSGSGTDTISTSSPPSDLVTSPALVTVLPTTCLLNPVEKKKIVKKRKAKQPEAVSTSNNSASGTDTISTSSPPSDLVTSPALVTALPTTRLLNPIEKKKIVKKRKAKQPEAVSTSNNSVSVTDTISSSSPLSNPAPVTASPTTSPTAPVEKKKMKFQQSAATSNGSASAIDILPSVPPSDPAAVSAPATALPTNPSTAPATVPPTTSPRTAPARVRSDPGRTEPDLCIAAYVTLAVNGESCDEEDAANKQIAQLPTPSPEADQPSVLLAHEIELATSNVPVYLLNGESRDVTTPVPPASSTSASAHDDAASEQ